MRTFFILCATFILTVMSAGAAYARNFIIQNATTSSPYFMVNGTSGYIGIGTSTPAGRLDVANGSIVNVGTPINPLDAATKNYVDSSVGSFWVANGTSIYNANAGNVGIGTTNPGYPLVVQVGSDARISINQTSNNNYGYNLSYNGTRQWDIYSNGSGGDLNFYSQTAGNAMTILQSSGNVGIGTTGPGSKLDIRGGELNLQSSGNYSSGTTGIYFGSADAGGLFKLDYTGDSLSFKNSWSEYRDQFVLSRANGTLNAWFTGNVGIGTTSPGTNLDVNGNAESSIYYDRDNTNYYMDLAANVMPYSLVTAGSVGIGTTNPGAGLKLDVPGNSYSQFGGLRLNGLDTSVNQIWQSNLNTTLGITANGGDISFGQTSGQQMIIKSGGNVGIGTTNPTKLLTLGNNGASSNVRNDILVYGRAANVGDNNPYASLLFTTSGDTGNRTASIVASNYINNNGTRLDFNVSDSLYPYVDRDAVTILGNGNVGIGTTSPSAKLQINGDYYSPTVVKGSCTGAVTIDWSAGNTQHCVLTGNVTFTFSNGQNGGNYRIILKQDATGSRTVTWPATVRWGATGLPTLSTAANATDYIGFIYNGVDSKYDGVAFNSGF